MPILSLTTRWLALAAALFLGSMTPSANALPQAAQDESLEDESTEVLSKKEAKARLKEEKKALASKEPRLRKEAIERLGQARSEEFVKTFVKALDDKDAQVVAAAYEALANQPFPDAQNALLRKMQSKKVLEDEARATALVRTLARTGWGKRGYDVLREAFDAVPPKTKKEVVKAFTAQKERRAFSLFVDHLDEPRPASVNSPSNPPAAYWKAKYKEWMFIKTDVKRGLEAVTGKTFANAKEARAWAKTKEARKAGFVYKAGS